MDAKKVDDPQSKNKVVKKGGCPIMPAGRWGILMFLGIAFHFFYTHYWSVADPHANLVKEVPETGKLDSQGNKVDTSRVWTLEELKKYDGSDPKLPILLGFNGKVYDVSSGAKFYGPKGGYKFFAGRDGTRGFFTGCFKPECLIPDLTGLNAQQMDGVKSWEETYNKKYIWVGLLHPDEVKVAPEVLALAQEEEKDPRGPSKNKKMN